MDDRDMYYTLYGTTHIGTCNLRFKFLHVLIRNQSRCRRITLIIFAKSRRGLHFSFASLWWVYTMGIYRACREFLWYAGSAVTKFLPLSLTFMLVTSRMTSLLLDAMKGGYFLIKHRVKIEGFKWIQTFQKKWRGRYQIICTGWKIYITLSRI